MASLGNLIGLDRLDMSGSRGDPRVLERRVWQAIDGRRRRVR